MLVDGFSAYKLMTFYEPTKKPVQSFVDLNSLVLPTFQNAIELSHWIMRSWLPHRVLRREYENIETPTDLRSN